MKKRHHRGRHAAPRPARRYAVAVASAACLVSTGTAGVLLTGSAVAGGPLDTPTLAAAGLDVTRVDPTTAAPTTALDRAAGNDVSRDMVRTPSPSPSTPGRRGPVDGLDQAQTDNAATVIAVARQRGLSQRAMVVALATAMQESDLHNVASPAVPESLNYPHQGVEVDHDSVGLFQQRPSQGWGTVAELMDPSHSAGLFLDALVRVPGWESMSVAGAAQAVQRSAFPDAYQQHQALAERVVAALA